MALSRSVRFANRIKAFWKFCLSFRKRDWVLRDYPVWIGEQELGPELESSRFKRHQYRASVVGWTLSAWGDSPTDAMDDLNTNFETAKAGKMREDQPLPRPGTHVPIEFSSQERVNLHPDLAQDFIQRVLELDWAWISDESSLWDFHADETNERLNAKIMDLYGVDVSDLESGKLSEIFDRIAGKEKAV
jgi:hypothetical protein